MEFIWNLSFLSSLILVVLIPILLKWIYASSSQKPNLPPSPPKFPIIGNFHQLGLLPHRTLQSLSKKYGPVMLLHFGYKPVLVVSSPEAACEIMKNNDLAFSSRPKSSMADKLLYGKDIAFAPYGEFLRQIRSICVLQLLSNKRVQSFRHVREEETAIMIKKIEERCLFTSSPVINLTDLFVTHTHDVICRVAFGRKFGKEEIGMDVKGMFDNFMELLGTSNIGDYIPFLGWMNYLNGLNAKADRTAKRIDEFIEDVIEEHINKKKIKDQCDDEKEARESDFVDILLDVQRENPHVGRDTLKALILDMFSAGTDTMHSAMEWAMVELLRHPEKLEKLQNEVRQAAQGKSEITEDDLEKVHYLKAVIKETLRLHCPLPLLIPRESTQDVQVMGYDIPARTQVLINAWAIGRDTEVWENAEDFKPERFLNNNGIDYRGLNFEFLPFGAGRRGCPGISFGIAVNEIVLAKLVHKFNFALPRGEKAETMDITEAVGIVVHRKLPILALATPCS